MQLNVTEWGDPAGAPVLCLHGVTGHGRRFRRLAEEGLPGHRVIGVDYRGHGRSGWEPPWSVEQHAALHTVGMPGRQLGDELAAEAVADPRAAGDSERVGGLDEVGDVLLHAPRRLPAGAPVTAVVDADHPIRGEALLGEPAEAAAVPGDAVQTDDRHAGRVSPFSDAQLHESTSLPKCVPAFIAPSAFAASASGWTESITGRHEPRPMALRKPS